MKMIIYQGVKYGIDSFLPQHPGGSSIIVKYLQTNQDITEMFKSTHSKEAHIKLLSLQPLQTTERTKMERLYCKIEERINRYYSPSYFGQITMALSTFVIFIATLYVQNPYICIGLFTISQILAAWQTHSLLHSRKSFFQKMGIAIGGLIMGLSASWWKERHFQHHIYTNKQKQDPELNSIYPVFTYPFSLVKWRFQSFFWGLKHLKVIEAVIILLHYYIIRGRPWIALISLAYAGFYLAIVGSGNHQRQNIFALGSTDSFLNTQLLSTRNYERENLSWLFLLGGFQYHSEHHLFPQVPFYNLRRVHKVVGEELEVSRKGVNYGPMLI